MALPIHSHNLGPSLPQDHILGVGDFLMSPNGRFCAQLQPNGTFGVYWNRTDAVIDPPPREFFPGEGAPLWISPVTGPVGDYFLAMQTDANLVVYHGTDFQHCGAVLWANHHAGSGTYVLNLQDNGCLMVKCDGAEDWQTHTDVADIYHLTAIVSQADDGDTTLALSTEAPIAGVAGMPGLSVTDLPLKNSEYAATPDQIWRRLYWYQDNDFVGCVLINPAMKAALAWDGGLKTTITTDITPLSTWTFGEPEDAWRAIRPLTNETVNLNVKGDPPYRSGTEVILWRWTKGGADNLIWEFFGNYDPKPPSPPVS